MKTNKTLLAILATTIILSLWIGSTYAYGWNWNWKGQWQWQWMSQWQWQWMNKWNSWGNSNWSTSKDHSTWDMIGDIEKQDVDAIEIDLLKKQYEEEMMANELYTLFYEMYGVQTFSNIAASEAQHMEAVKVLLDRYEVEIPTNYDHIQSLYDDLKEKWSSSLKDALEVWVSIEIVDIDDIVTAIKSTDNDDIKTVFTNIGWGSYNHMRWFVKALANNNLTTDIDYSDYLSSDDVDSKWSIKVKLAEKLESEWVDLPEQVSSTSIQENCENEGEGNQTNKWQQNSSEVNKGKQWQNNYNNDIKNEYKEKYSDTVSKLDDEKLNILIDKIDELSEKIQNWNYSLVVKQKYAPILMWLRELAIENLDENSELDIDNLFN